MDYIKIRLLNNRVNSTTLIIVIGGENERQYRTDGINIDINLPDVLCSVINKTITNVRMWLSLMVILRVF